MNKASKFLQAIVGEFRPEATIFYGSGVKGQEGNLVKSMVDAVFVIEPDKINEFYSDLLIQRRDDFPLLIRALGSNFSAWLQKMGAGISYFPYVDFEDRKIKYGVIPIDILKEDLTEWTHLYVAGRCHKPVELYSKDKKLNKAMETNRKHAVNAALLILPERFTEKDLFMTITSLSYSGDTRMKFAENPKKVANIVNGNMKEFRDIYRPLIGEMKFVADCGNRKYRQNMDRNWREELYDRLPFNVRFQDVKVSLDVVDSQFNIQLSKLVSAQLSRSVGRSSLSQTLKGFVTAGPKKSFWYLSAKIGKFVNGKKGL